MGAKAWRGNSFTQHVVEHECLSRESDSEERTSPDCSLLGGLEVTALGRG